jgi:intracellular septation protein A
MKKMLQQLLVFFINFKNTGIVEAGAVKAVAGKAISKFFLGNRRRLK